MTRKDFQKELVIAGLKQWQIADYLGIHEGTLSKLFRNDLSSEMTEKIKQAIKALSEN